MKPKMNFNSMCNFNTILWYYLINITVGFSIMMIKINFSFLLFIGRYYRYTYEVGTFFRPLFFCLGLPTSYLWSHHERVSNYLFMSEYLFNVLFYLILPFSLLSNNNKIFLCINKTELCCFYENLINFKSMFKFQHLLPMTSMTNCGSVLTGNTSVYSGK